MHFVCLSLEWCFEIFNLLKTGDHCHSSLQSGHRQCVQVLEIESDIAAASATTPRARLVIQTRSRAVSRTSTNPQKFLEKSSWRDCQKWIVCGLSHAEHHGPIAKDLRALRLETEAQGSPCRSG